MQNMTKIRDMFNEAGGVTQIASSLGMPIGTVSAWISRDTIPAERVLQVEKATGIPRERLRPDLYPSHREEAKAQ